MTYSMDIHKLHQNRSDTRPKRAVLYGGADCPVLAVVVLNLGERGSALRLKVRMGPDFRDGEVYRDIDPDGIVRLEIGRLRLGK